MKNRLDNELLKRRLTPSRSIAKQEILSGNVFVDGISVLKPNTSVSSENNISLLKNNSGYIGRGEKKLSGAIIAWGINVKDKIIIDVGSSTGGFVNVLLSRGARKIYAVDVGTGQLHPSLRKNKKVISLEQTDIRSAEIPEPADIATIDVSFISLEKILVSVKNLLAPDGIIIALVKPQFEVGKVIATKYKGIIDSESERQKVISKINDYAKSIGLSVLDTMQSPITGTDGNIEYFVYLKK